MVETGERKGLSRVTLHYHLFCRNVGRKGVFSSYLCYHKMVMRIWELMGLPRATINHHKIKEIEREGAASNLFLL